MKSYRDPVSRIPLYWDEDYFRISAVFKPYWLCQLINPIKIPGCILKSEESMCKPTNSTSSRANACGLITSLSQMKLFNLIFYPLLYLYTCLAVLRIIFLKQIRIDVLKKCIMAIPPGQDGTSWMEHLRGIILIFKILILYFQTFKQDPIPPWIEKMVILYLGVFSRKKN